MQEVRVEPVGELKTAEEYSSCCWRTPPGRGHERRLTVWITVKIFGMLVSWCGALSRFNWLGDLILVTVLDPVEGDDVFVCTWSVRGAPLNEEEVKPEVMIDIQPTS